MGNPEVVRLLLSAGADVNAFLNPANEGVTAFHLADQSGYVEIVQVLLKAGASVNAYTTPLLDGIDFASRLLGTKSATFDTDRQLRGFTALHLPASASHEVVKALIDAGAKLEGLTTGNTPYLTTVQLGVYTFEGSEF